MRTLRGIFVTVLISAFGGCGATSPCMDAHERLQNCIDSLHCGSMPVAACQDIQQSLVRSAKLAGECSDAALQYANELNSCELDSATCECKNILFGNACVNPGAAVTSGVSFINKSPFCATNLCMVTPPTSRAPLSSPHTSSELAICTRHCESDRDCESGMPSAGCPRYLCAYPSTLPGSANHCCEKLCVCENDLIPGYNTDGTGPRLERDGNGVPVPKACIAGASLPGPCLIR